jgi:hypothetical protein
MIASPVENRESNAPIASYTGQRRAGSLLMKSANMQVKTRSQSLVKNEIKDKKFREKRNKRQALEKNENIFVEERRTIQLSRCRVHRTKSPLVWSEWHLSS